MTMAATLERFLQPRGECRNMGAWGIVAIVVGALAAQAKLYGEQQYVLLVRLCGTVTRKQATTWPALMGLKLQLHSVPFLGLQKRLHAL